MGVRLRAAVAGEVLQAGQHAALLQAARHGGDHIGGDGGVAAERAVADLRVVRIRHDVCHRCKVHVEACSLHLTAQLLAHGLNGGRVSGRAVGRHRVQYIRQADAAQARHAPALLIHAQQQRDLAVALRGLQHLRDLLCRYDVLREIHQPADGRAFQRLARGVPCRRGGGEARQCVRRDDEELAELLVEGHAVQDLLRGQLLGRSGLRRGLRFGRRVRLRSAGRHGGGGRLRRLHAAGGRGRACLRDTQDVIDDTGYGDCDDQQQNGDQEPAAIVFHGNRPLYLYNV